MNEALNLLVHLTDRL